MQLENENYYILAPMYNRNCRFKILFCNETLVPKMNSTKKKHMNVAL